MSTLPINRFKELFPKNHIPEITELENFWSNGVSVLFRNFAKHISDNYDLRFGIPVWSEKNGWTYRIGKSGIYLIKGIQIEKNGFIVDGILVNDETGYCLAIDYVKTVYEKKQYEFENKIIEKNARQARRNKVRKVREREEFLAMKDLIIPEKYNVFHWPSKLDISKLKKLYNLDAQGIQDTVLADEIGLTLYIRCKYGKEDMERMEKYIIRCHNCEAELRGDTDFRQCSCGHQYSYKEYRRSYRKNNMPTGAAAKIFETFVTKWSLAKSYQEKMILIDTLLHEFHLNLISGAVHRPVAMNFMDGTRAKVEGIINDLSEWNG